jgi:hypothetical protein
MCPFLRLSRHGRASGAKASLRRTGRPATVSMNTRVASISGGPGPGDGPSLPLPCHHRILGTQARTRRDETRRGLVMFCTPMLEEKNAGNARVPRRTAGLVLRVVRR